MIYQLTPFSDKLREPFSHLYKNFVMEEDPFILETFPRADERKALVEYLGLYYCWKKTKHTWIGFTSYRQMEKSPFIFSNEDEITSLLKNYDIITWMALKFPDHRVKSYSDAPKLGILLRKLGLTLPRKGRFVYCNYFIMNWDNFDSYMSWSWPYVQKMLELREDPSLRLSDGHFSNLGQMVERLFIIWHVSKAKKVISLCPNANKYHDMLYRKNPKLTRLKLYLRRLYYYLTLPFKN